MNKDKRYKTVKILIEGGHISEFKQIFEHIPKTTVAEQLGIHFHRFAKMIDNITEMKMKDLLLISGYFDVNAKTLFELIYAQHENNSRSKKK